eukprot:355163-Chlamydomonas_euryale.AAC.1
MVVSLWIELWRSGFFGGTDDGPTRNRTCMQFMEVGEITLAPEVASVGLDIRVVGNDSGEKV